MSLNRVTTKLKIDMSGSTKQYMVSAKQGDRATRYVEITLLNGSEEYEIPTGSQVTAYVKKPDDTIVYTPCTFDGSVVTMELTSQTLAAYGTALAEVEVKSSDLEEVITSVTFEINIEKCVKDEDAILSSDEISALDAQMQSYAQAEAERAAAEQARVSAENSRVTAESSRVSAESSRVSAESARVQAEAARVEAENARVSAENSRVSAENTRQSNATTVLDKANEAVEVAEQVNEAKYIYDSDNDIKYAYSLYALRGVPHLALTAVTT